MDSMDSGNPLPNPIPISYAATLLQPIGARDFNSEAMLGDFVLEDEDFQVSDGSRGPSFCFSSKVEEKLNSEWNCAVIVKLMGKPNVENAYKFMFDALNRKWVTKGPWQLIDLPNGFFAVKFQLFEDRDYVLCNGPWIIAGQTLVVQKWRPDFDPLTDKISRMAVWIRILDLPVKYYKEYALQKIGGIIGPVVKIDKVTLAQNRGKFCRLCVEVNLDERLKPFVQMGDKPLGVVYEGISTICFNCGVYGHVHDHCPYISAENTMDAASTGPGNKVDDATAAETMGDDGLQNIDSPPVQTHMPIKDTSAQKAGDIGPWMVMSYKNRKKNISNANGSNKKSPQGSRFAPLLDTDNDVERPSSSTSPIEPAKHTVEPTIVKLWKSVPQKLQASDQKQDQNMKQATTNISSKVPLARTRTMNVPLKDISNVGSKSTIMYAKKSSKKHGTLVKDKAPTSGVKSSFPINCDIDVSDSASHASSSLDVRFGHSPPEELVGKVSVENESSMVEVFPDVGCADNNVDVSTYDDAVLAGNLCSSKEEDMVIS